MWCVSIRPDSLHVRMHNGQISQFPKIKRRLLEALPDPLFLLPQGQTDSEYAFALYLSHLKDPESLEVFSHQELKVYVAYYPRYKSLVQRGWYQRGEQVTF